MSLPSAACTRIETSGEMNSSVPSLVGAEAHALLLDRDHRSVLAAGPAAALHLVGDAAVGEREDLEAARVGDQRPLPAHESVQAAGGGDPLRPRRDEQVVGVAEDQLVAEPGDLPRLEPAHRPLGRQGNERRRLHRPVRGVQHPGPSRPIPRRDLEPQPVRLVPHPRRVLHRPPHGGHQVAVGDGASRERPVIAAGWGMPRRSRTVGATSARMPRLAQGEALGGDDQRHRVERVGGVG